MNRWRIFSRVFHGGHLPDATGERKKTIDEARRRRQAAESKIDGMIAQLNGCGDRWFLYPVKTLDECGQEEANGK